MKDLDAYVGRLTSEETEDLLRLCLNTVESTAALRIVVDWARETENGEELVAALDDIISEGPY